MDTYDSNIKRINKEQELDWMACLEYLDTAHTASWKCIMRNMMSQQVPIVTFSSRYLIVSYNSEVESC